MSRFIRNPVQIPDGVQVQIADGTVSMRGPIGEVSRRLNDERLTITQQDNQLVVGIADNADDEARALAGTYWRLLEGMVQGVKASCEKVLELSGVGYRAQMEGNTLILQLGFSHPIRYSLPAAVQVQLPSQTEIIIKGADKQQVGQVAAEIRSYRPPEPYKGKGVRYRGERIIIKETKKK